LEQESLSQFKRRMMPPWIPELFSAPALARIEERRNARMSAVPYFDGLLTGEMDARIGSFAGQPELHDPIRGRVRGVSAFARFVTDTTTWMAERNVTVEDVDVIATPSRGTEEVVLHVDGDAGRIQLPLALAAERPGRAHHRAAVVLQHVAGDRWHAVRPPLLQPDSDLHEPDVVGDYQRALAAGDVDAAVAAFEPDAYVREPAGGAYTHRGTDELRALYERFFSNGGGIPLEHCAATDDGGACALEYNVVAWGRTELAPQAGIAVYVRGDSGRLAAARIYDDTDPPLSRV
jgi:hypothetical protein